MAIEPRPVDDMMELAVQLLCKLKKSGEIAVQQIPEIGEVSRLFSPDRSDVESYLLDVLELYDQLFEVVRVLERRLQLVGGDGIPIMELELGVTAEIPLSDTSTTSGDTKGIG